MKRIVYLLIFSSFLFSQNKRYFDFDEIDGPKVFSKPSSIAHPSLPALNKPRDPSVIRKYQMLPNIGPCK